MRLVLLSIVVALSAVVAQVPVPYKNCGKSSDIIQIVSLRADKWPPVRGQPMTVMLNGQVSRSISNGDYEAVVKFNGFQILDKTGKLSDIQGLPLPIPAGNYQQNLTFTVPSWIPAGQVDAHVTLYDNTGAECICLDLSIPLRQGKGQSEVLADLFSQPEATSWVMDVPIPYKNCGSSSDLAKVTNAQADMWPPQKGKPLSFVANATLAASIPDATYEAQVKWNGIKIVDQKGKISDFKNVTLPIPAGNYGIAKKVDIPSWVPSGQIDVHVSAKSTASGNPQIACLELSLNLK